MGDLYNAKSTCGVKAAVDLTEHRFVGFDGNYAASASALVKGITQFSALTGAQATLINGGTALLEINATISTGQEISAGANGMGVLVTNSSAFPLGNVVSAIALEDGVTGDVIEVQIVAYKI